MFIYRVETVDGKGPHDHTIGIGPDLSYANGPDSHPTPRYDYSMGATHLLDMWESASIEHNIPMDDWFFGFTSHNMLMTWFYNQRDRALLREHGYAGTSYTVPGLYVVQSLKQAVFVKKHATKVSRSPLHP